MSTRRSGVLAHALTHRGSTIGGDAGYWERLIREARESNLLGTLAERLAERSLIERAPDAPRAHLVAARIRSAAQATAIRRELRHLARALAGIDYPIVLLKGAAYLCANLPVARGRMFADIDILVPKGRLLDIESALMQAGFVSTHTNAYDQRYYRQWMHELPPMQHVRRQTVLDVHHALVPETSRMRPDSSLLLKDALLIDESVWRLSGALPPRASVKPAPPTRGDTPGADPVHGEPLAFESRDDSAHFRVLGPCDMTIHCATHLFCDEDFSHAPRDLVDFDGLVRHFAAGEPDFWTRLVSRARALQLARPLSYALHWSAYVHRTPVPPEVLRDAHGDAAPFPIRQVMNVLLAPALRPTRGRASTRWARRALYVRGHWLKMPPHLLAWHLTVKAFRREETSTADGAREPKMP